MTRKRLVRATAGLTGLITLLVGSAPQPASAESPPSPIKLAGVINDYVESGGAWHINGEWSVRASGAGGTAEFTASLTMQRSDLWVQLTMTDPTNPALRAPHTHHVGLVDGTLTPTPTGWRISGTAIITSNGNPAGFSGSPIDVEIVGGATVPTANVKLTFGGAAVGHFGAQPIDGVVVLGR